MTSRRHLLAAISCCMLAACGNGKLVAFEPDDSGVADPGLVDDFEDLNNRAENAFGWWYIVNDRLGSQTMEFTAPSDRPGDKGALHSVGSGFTKWGAIVGVSFDHAVDLRQFSALEFIAETGTAGSGTAMMVWLFDSSNNSFGTPAPLTSSWSGYHVTLSGGVSPKDPSLKLDPSEVIGIQFSFDTNSTDFDLWLDDVRFVE